MNLIRRKTLLACLALPAGCGLPPLPPVSRQSVSGPSSAVAIRPPAIGQHWTYQKLNNYTSQLVAVERDEITALSPQIIISRATDAGQKLPEERQESPGQVVREPQWDFTQNYVDPVPLWPAMPSVGAFSDVRADYRLDNFSFPFWIQVQSRVLGWERVRAPAGEFTTLHVERLINIKHQDISRSSTTRWDHLWLAPEIGRWVVREISGVYVTGGKRGGGREDNFRWELKSWT
jgi:hypothetical protein